MKEIKFRAWNKYTQKMESSDTYWIYPDGTIGDEKDSWKNELVLMQFTGLRDKNGKEVYEGDIVNLRGRYGNKEIFEFPLSKGKTKNIIISFEDFMYILKEIEEPLYRLDELLLDIEVIGNVYENPELINNS